VSAFRRPSYTKRLKNSPLSVYFFKTVQNYNKSRKGQITQMKKFSALLLLIATLFTLLAVTSSASFGNGVTAVASDVSIIKSGLYGQKLTFSDADFKQGLCINDFKRVTLTQLPNAEEGTLMIAGRRATEGVSIKRRSLPTLVFIPTSKDVKEASFKFKIDEYAGGEELTFKLRFTDKINYEPSLPDSNEACLNEKTQREIGVFGRMEATDGEGDSLEFMVVSYPERGALTILDKASGKYLYTPDDGFVGEDSFVYVARDEWGNFSETAEVSITVDKRMSEVRYVDMQNRPEYSAAVAMTAMGIMGGRVLGDGVYFDPDETVTKAEFVAMTMRTLGIEGSHSASTFFDDNADIPAPLVGYVARAQRLGAINGTFEDGRLLFKPNEEITRYEAAMIMASLIGAKADDETPVFNGITDLPCYARDEFYVMCDKGVFELDGGALSASGAVTRADAARYLYRLMSI